MPKRRRTPPPPAKPDPDPEGGRRTAELLASDPDGAVTVACERSLRVFYEEAFPTIQPGEPFQSNWHIDAICEHLEAVRAGQIENLGINMPPRFGKSNLCAVGLPAWLWLGDPSEGIVAASYVQDYATRDSVATRALVQSPWYQARWGDRFAITTDQNEKMNFQNDKKGFRKSVAVGGSMTGGGGDWTIIDDPHNAKETPSEAKMESVRFWWTNVMPTRTGRYGRTKRVLVMQRLDEKDLSGLVMDLPNWTMLVLPMEFERKRVCSTRIGWRDPRSREGELLWTQRFPRKYIDGNLKPPQMSAQAYAGQYQQRPAPAEGGMFKRENWQYHRYRRENVPALLAKADDKCWSWDCAFKDLKSSDFVAGTAWVRVGAEFFLLPHTVHEQLTFGGTKAAVRTTAALWPSIHAKLVEDKANGTAVVDDLKRKVGGLIPVEPEGGKEARASVVQTYQEAKNIFLPDPKHCPWVEQYVHEHAVFPNGANDDWVDSTSQAIVWMLNRMLKGFTPIVTSYTKSASGVHRGEVYRDPREGEGVASAVGYSERGDASQVECLKCGSKFPESRAADHVADSPRCAGRGFRPVRRGTDDGDGAGVAVR